MPNSKRGRPPSTNSLGSKAANYQALAWQVSQRIESAKQQGKKLPIKKAVEEEMLLSVKHRNDIGVPTNKYLIETRSSTAYTEVRKILAEWKKAK